VELPRSSYTVKLDPDARETWDAIIKQIPDDAWVQFYTEVRTAPDGTDRTVLFLTVRVRPSSTCVT
jgi:hypothetical protein